MNDASFSLVQNEELRLFNAELIRLRWAGELMCNVNDIDSKLHLENPADVSAVIELLLQIVAPKHAQVAWLKIDRATAIYVLNRVLEKDLAYDAAIMTHFDAVRLTQQFLSWFANDARYYTNLHCRSDSAARIDVPLEAADNPLIHGWHPLMAPDSIDTGVIVLTERRVGLLWVIDKD